MKNIIKFNSKSKEGNILSNFANLPFAYCDNVSYNNVTPTSVYYISGEHAFHGQKYLNIALKCADPVRQRELFDYAKKFSGKNPDFETPLDAKRGGGKKGKMLVENEIEYWNSISESIQRNICINKIREHEIVKDYLNCNKDKYLLHQENRATVNTIWGGRIVDDKLIGQNKLGKIWMEYADM